MNAIYTDRPTPQAITIAPLPDFRRHYIVTVKLPKLPDHNPQKKVNGICRLHYNTFCTDVTGEHHSFLVIALSADHAKEYYESLGHHVTRVESVPIPAA